MPRERALFVGDVGSGKTRAMFSIARFVIEKLGRKVFFFPFDAGHERFMNKNVMEWVNKEKFFVYDDIDTWPHTKSCYDDSKDLWEDGDWVMLDRIDMAWQQIRDHFSALKEDFDIQDTSEYFLQKRLDALKKEETKEQSLSERDYSQHEWDLMRGALRAIVFDVTGGLRSRKLHINTVMSELAIPGIQIREREPTMVVKDPRRIYEYNYVIQGEKNVPGWLDSLVLFERTPRGYVFHTTKDRERKLCHNILIPDDQYWLDIYQEEIGEEIF